MIGKRLSHFRILSKIGREMAPDIKTQILDSMKMMNPKNQARKPADFRVRTTPLSVIHLTKPFIPPEYWVKVITAPIRALKRMTLVLSGWVKTVMSASMAWIIPLTGFQLLMIIHPSQIPKKSER